MSTSAAIWSHRGFIAGSVKREFQARYSNSLLGAVWGVLNPLALVFIYIVVFSTIMQARIPDVQSEMAYGVYLCSGILTWGFFTEIVTRGQTVFLDNANLIKKLSFPRICLPLIVILNASLNFAIVFTVFIVFLLLSGNFPGWVSLSAFVVLGIQLMFAIGLGVTLGVLNVFFRDVGHVFGIILQFWFWFTPIVYPIAILPAWIQPIIQLNPMTTIMSSYQSIFVFGRQPDWFSLIPVIVISFLICVLAAHLFKKHAAEIVDEI